MSSGAAASGLRKSSVRLLCCVAAVLALAVVGCGKKQAKPAEVTTTAPGAAVTHFENTPAKKPLMAASRVPPAPRPTGPLPAKASCVTDACHATYKYAPQVHLPVAAGACNTCHAEDQGGHKYPLKRQANETCTFCHSVSGTQAHQHAAITTTGCLSCHNPHTSDAKYLLSKSNVEQTCTQCHQMQRTTHEHGPFAAGQCTVCHQPHQSQTKNLLRGGEGAQHCLMCHGDIQKTLVSAKHLHDPAKRGCTTCHGPHATPAAKQLKAPPAQLCNSCHAPIAAVMKSAPVHHAAMTDPRSCANCHSPHASNQPKLLRQKQQQTCLTCHSKPIKAEDGRMIADMRTELSAKFLHGPVRNGDCSACHTPHGGQNAGLLAQAFPRRFYASFALNDYALCFRCHDQQLVLSKKTEHLTNFRDGDRNLHYIHVNRDPKGRTCKTCHEMHGSNLPNHMAESVPFEGSNWSMPIRYEKKDSGGSCAPGCHQPQSYSRSRAATTQSQP